ncbi:MAG: TldD/PmbA family protein [Actinobacteria bacterium]|nr:MAG: TldD/PmbA family protein [Actinomycetota bacterium]
MSGPVGEERLADAAEAAFGAGADGVLVLAFHSWGGLTRFASSRIHQNTWREDVEFRVMAVADGNRTGVAATHSLDPAVVRRAADDALAIARIAPPDPDFPGLAPPAPVAHTAAFDDETANATPAARASAVAGALGELPAGMEGTGYVETAADEVLVCSTTGLRAFAATTHAGCSVLAIAPDSSGYAERLERRFGEVDTHALAGIAADKAERSADPQPVDAGPWTVILEPAATSTILQFLGYLGFGGKAYLEGRSFLTGRLGSKLMADAITIVDDATAPDALGLPFDFEGMPSQRVTLIDKGVARSVVWDRATAKKAGTESTGHGLPPPNSYGPLPLNLRMEPGENTLDDMIASTERGLLVTRFHYSNVVNEKETILTGMTRDGTFLIQDGKVANGVRNLRYTQNAVEALANVEAVGDTTEISTEMFFGGSRAPAIKIREFKFSSTTTH